MIMKLNDIIKGLELFSGLSESELAQVEQLGQMIEYEEGAEIFHEASTASDLYLLIDGRVQVNVELGKIEVATFHTILPGKLFGEFSFIDQQPRSATAIAIKKSSIIKFGRDHLLEWFEQNHHAGYCVMFNMSKILARRIRQSGHELKSSLMWEKSS